MKKIYFVFIGLILSSISIKHTQAFFQDVDVTHPYYYSIRYLHDNRVVEGYSLNDEQYYRPVNPISRVAALKILLLSTQEDLDDSGGLEFPDVDRGQWYFPYVKTAYKKEIVGGFKDGKFYPGAEVSRAQMLKMTLIAFGAEVDDEDIYDNWYEPYMKFGEDFRIIEANEKPHKQLSRGEVAEMIYRTRIVAENSFETPYTYSGFGLASYYAGKFHGRTTASGEIYNKDDLTAAHRTLPFGTRLKVTHQDKSVIVRINDRGPYHKNRIIDLSEGAFKKLAPTSTGILPITFQIYTHPEETIKSVPEYLREELETPSLNPAIPETVALELTNNTNEKNTPSSYMEGTIPFLSKTFFPNIKMNKPFPQKVYEGDVIFLSGRAVEPGHKKIHVFLNANTNNPKDFNFTSDVTGGVFEVPIVFSKAGQYKIGVVFDDQKQSKAEIVTVLPRPKNEYFGTGKVLSDKKMNISTNTKEQVVSISIDKQKAFEKRVFKLIIHQPEKFRDFRIEGGVQTLALPFSTFNAFHIDEEIQFELYEAPSADGTLSEQQGSWKKIGTNTFIIKKAFPDREKGHVYFSNFPQYHHALGQYTLRGRKENKDTHIREEAFVTQQGQLIQTFPVDFEREDYFTIPLEFKDYGTYIIEVLSEEGEILFNKAIYVYPENVLPLKPWQETISIQPSKANMRYWINAVRKQYNKQGLRADDRLNVFAQEYANYMAEKNFIGHTDPNGRTFEDRIKSFELKGEYAENLSYGENLDVALQGLENSGAHLKNMIASHWKSVGIGFATNKRGDYYVVHVFGR